MDPRLHTPLPRHFEWANSAHTDFKDAHIIVLEREVWVSVALPRQRAEGWEVCTGVYRRHFGVGRWVNMRNEAEAVRWMAGWVTKYADRIVAEAPRRRHRPVAPNHMLDRFKHGR
ncbi:hypothetical protein [Lysobacter capsici]|uniref:hypothetical protein n=1 Tax=Lysobacter capsici TaxID=435897 RepID=UPI001C008687|nr:hypothetical protein [Lysobacter capsici]QWF19312.1 hypothetical protein KME82_11505 [Lysobacter capsici]